MESEPNDVAAPTKTPRPEFVAWEKLTELQIAHQYIGVQQMRDEITARLALASAMKAKLKEAREEEAALPG